MSAIHETTSLVYTSLKHRRPMISNDANACLFFLNQLPHVSNWTTYSIYCEMEDFSVEKDRILNKDVSWSSETHFKPVYQNVLLA